MRKSTYSILLILSCSLLAVACQKEKKSKAPAGPACGSDKSLNQNVAVRTDVFKLSREYGFAARTDCAGKTTTSRVTLKEPKDAYSLQALTLTPNSGNYSVSAINRTTCDQATIKKHNPGDTRMEIQFHTSRGTRRTYVLKNTDNYIDYEFRRCSQLDAGNNCVKSEVAERGTVILKVEYSETENPVPFETKETCPSPDQKKP